jgi:molybdate/tungstate transport system substrate-binding protein
MRATVLAGVCLAMAAVVASCGGEATRGLSAPAPSVAGMSAAPFDAGSTASILHAGMVENLVKDGLAPAAKQTDELTVHNTKGNSVALADSVKARRLSGDLFMSADASVNKTLMGPSNGEWVRWFVVFARNEVVLAYSPKSRFAAQFEQAGKGRIPWYQVLEQPGVLLGRDNPNLDPLGYYDLFVGQLAERYYHRPGLKQRILGDDNNPMQVRDTSPLLLSSGLLDAQFMYVNKAKDAHVPYIRLPDEINLGNPDMAVEYAGASFTTDKGQTLRGAPIQVSIAPLKNGNPQAATQLIELLTSPQGADLLRRFHFPPSPIMAGGDVSAVPPALKPMIHGTYQPQ